MVPTNKMFRKIAARIFACENSLHIHFIKHIFISFKIQFVRTFPIECGNEKNR